uniref:Uncharacterized protein n=1 Tax=Plectus sambesii TaxID=2011161 RepID=A0A914W8Z2_9BILA
MQSCRVALWADGGSRRLPVTTSLPAAMRKRRRWTSVLLIVGVLGCLVFVGYLSTCTEVSYFVQLNKFDGSRSPRELARFASSTGCSQTEPDIPECETIHVGIVCAGFDSAARTSTLVKSLLYHRRHPLHLHLVVDNSSHLVLERLFETWQLPAVAVSLYDSEAVVEQVSWIPNRHYSGIYGLLKLTLPDVLPTDLDKVRIFD